MIDRPAFLGHSTFWSQLFLSIFDFPGFFSFRGPSLDVETLTDRWTRSLLIPPVSMIDSVDFSSFSARRRRSSRFTTFFTALSVLIWNARCTRRAWYPVWADEAPEDSDIFRYQLCFSTFYSFPFQIMILAFHVASRGSGHLDGRSHGTLGQAGLWMMLRLSHMAWAAFSFFAFGWIPQTL